MAAAPAQCADGILRMPALVRFRDLLPVYIYGEDILVAFDYADGLVVSSDDWIGLFPAKWTRPDQFIAYKKAPPHLGRRRNGRSFLYTLVFHTYSIEPPLWQSYGSGCAFQFAFVSHAFDAVLGVSSFFSVRTIDDDSQTAPLFEVSLPATVYESPFAAEQDSFDSRQYLQYHRTLASISSVNLSESRPTNSGWRSNCCQTPTPYYNYDPPLADLGLDPRGLERQDRLDVWNIANPGNRCSKPEIESDAQRSLIELKTLPPVDVTQAMSGNFYQRNTADPSSSHAYHRPSINGIARRDLSDGTPKDPHSVSDHNPEDESSDQLLLPSQNESQEIEGQHSQSLSKQRELQKLSSLTRRMTVSEHRYQARLELMEKEQLRFIHRFDELSILLARTQTENEQLRNFVQRLTDEKILLIIDFNRLELHNAAMCKEYQRQRVHLQDLYFTLNLHGFDYVVLPDGRKIETCHRPASELLSFEQNRRWSVCQDKCTPAFDYRMERDSAPMPKPAPMVNQAASHQARNSIAQSCEQLMRKLADLQQQRDHIDGYIDWLKAEARKKEHIYDDPFTGDIRPSEDDFEILEHKPDKANHDPRLSATQLTRDSLANAPPASLMPSRNSGGLPKASQHQNYSLDDGIGGLHDSLGSSPAHTNHEQRRRVNDPVAATSHANEHRGSFAAARARFLRKDSLLAVLLDSGSGILSKPRRSIFSRQKPQHNAFVTGRGYSMHANEFGAVGSPKPTRKIRTHIL